jgi:hypothetical protein
MRKQKKRELRLKLEGNSTSWRLFQSEREGGSLVVVVLSSL